MLRAAIPHDELGNALSHGLGCVLALGALPLLARAGTTTPTALRESGLALYALSLLSMFVVSALYHASPAGPAKQRLRRLDHAVIFLFIAGSCTPFALGRLDPLAQLPALAAVWVVALAGMLLKLAGRLRHPLLSTLLYLVFGWLAAAAAWPALGELDGRALALLVDGWLAYTLGCVFYLRGDRVRQAHFVWHLFVMLGSGLHLAAVLLAGH